MQNQTKQSGYSLVEVLVAVMVLMLAIVGPLTIAATGLKNASRAKVQTTAFFLAQEGIEAVVKAREDSALNTYSGGSGTVWDQMELLDGTDASPLCTESVPCGVDVGVGSSLFSCGVQTCDIYYDQNAIARYNHDPSGTDTQYRREIILDVSEARAHVRSIVTWGEAEDERVELSEYIYNIYEQ